MDEATKILAIALLILQIVKTILESKEVIFGSSPLLFYKKRMQNANT